MADVILGTVVPKKVWLVGVFEKDETGSVTVVHGRKDYLATTGEGAKAQAIAKLIEDNKNVDLSRVTMTVTEVATQ